MKVYNDLILSIKEVVFVSAIESDEGQQTESQPPSFIQPITNKMATEGTPAKFTAVFSGQAEITWIRNGIQTLQDCREFKVCFHIYLYSLLNNDTRGAVALYEMIFVFL